MSQTIVEQLGAISGAWVLMLFGTSLGMVGKKQPGISGKGIPLFAASVCVAGAAVFFMLYSVAGASLPLALAGTGILVATVMLGLAQVHKIPVILVILALLAGINGFQRFSPWFLAGFIIAAACAFFITRKNLIHGKALSANGADFQFTLAVVMITIGILAGFHWSFAGLATDNGVDE